MTDTEPMLPAVPMTDDAIEELYARYVRLSAVYNGETGEDLFVEQREAPPGADPMDDPLYVELDACEKAIIESPLFSLRALTIKARLMEESIGDTGTGPHAVRRSVINAIDRLTTDSNGLLFSGRGDGSDDALTAAASAHAEAVRLYNDLAHQDEDHPGLTAAHDRMEAALDILIKTPAMGAVGMQVKARALRVELPRNTAETDISPLARPEERLAWSLAGDVLNAVAPEGFSRVVHKGQVWFQQTVFATDDDLAYARDALARSSASGFTVRPDNGRGAFVAVDADGQIVARFPFNTDVGAAFRQLLGE